MAVSRPGLFSRVVPLTLVALLAGAGATFAAEQQAGAPALVLRADPKPAAPTTLAVPDVRGEPYVFAKSILEESGFAWRVVGRVAGYATNVVAAQTPAPGTTVVDSGAPTVVLHLVRSKGYPERGAAENRSPYAGSNARVVPTEQIR